MAEPIITNDDFNKFREFFYRKTGISFEPSKRYFVDKRLVERIEASQSDTFRSYFAMMRFQASGDELQMLTNLREHDPCEKALTPFTDYATSFTKW